MKTIRIIPKLDIKGPNLVKGIHLEGLRVLGKPEDFAKYYYENGADELLYMDVVASLYQRNSLHDIIQKTAKEIFIPLTVGGGIRTIDDIKQVLRAGADKVSLNTAAIENPPIVKAASTIFGSSTITISIEAIKQPDGRYLAYVDNGREYTGKEVAAWAKEVEKLGAGEIIITSVDRDGTAKGFDTELIKIITKNITIPLVASGGAGKAEDIKEAVLAGADAVALASLLHYNYIKDHPKEIEVEKEGNIEYLKSGSNFTKVSQTSISDIKKYLKTQQIPCRI